MTSREAVLTDRYGLHPRAALRIQQEAAKHETRVTIAPAGGGAAIAASSMISLVSAGIRTGDRVVVSGDGGDAEAAVAAIAELIGGGVCHP